jgi:pimeloyl-ACP methyl ester carboxylesterase
LEPFVLLGESFSSPLAIHLAGSRPSNLAGLIICAGFVSNPFPQARFLMKALAKPFLFRLPAPEFINKYFLTGWSESAVLIRRVRENLLPVAPDVIAGRVQEILNCDARQDLVRVNVPILDLRGAYDRLIGRKCMEEIQKARTGIRRVSLPAPHLILQRKPHEAADAVVNFVREIETEQAIGRS